MVGHHFPVCALLMERWSLHGEPLPYVSKRWICWYNHRDSIGKILSNSCYSLRIVSTMNKGNVPCTGLYSEC